jgi:hypothetical protein
MRAFLAPIVTIGLVVNSMIGCSKESTTSTPSTTTLQSNKLLENSLLKRLPATAVGFIVSDLQGDGYRKFKDSPWFNDMPFQSALEELDKAGADADQKKIVEALMQFLKKLGALSPDGKSNIDQVAGSFVLLADQPAATPQEIDIAAYLSAAQTTNLKEKLPILRDALKEIGATVSDDTVAGADAFVAVLKTPSESEEDTKEFKLHVGASEKYLGISDSKALVEGLFAPKESNGFDTIKELPEFKRAETAVRGAESPLFLGFVSTAKLLPALKTASSDVKKGLVAEINSTDGAEAGDAGVVAEQPTVPDFDPKDLPIDGLMVSQGIDQGFVTRGGVAVTAKTGGQRAVFGALSQGALPAAVKNLPGDMALALALDTTSIAKLEPLMKDLELSGAVPNLQQIKALKGLTFGIRNSDSGSPIPELLLALESDNRDDLATTLEGTFSEGMKSTGQEAMWMSKDIAGSPTRYFTTLLGVGLFMSKPTGSNTILITSSERAVKDTLGSNPNAPKLQATATTGDKTGSLYLNFAEVANVVDTVKGSLAMFTGGSSDIDKALDSAKLRKIGVSASTLGYQDGLFVIESTLVPPTTK